MRILRVLVAIAVLTTAWQRPLLAQDHKPSHWSYSGTEGPSHWGELAPAFATCKRGHEQSPIDIRAPQKTDLPAIQFNYKPSVLRIIDNGHTIMINYAPGSFIRVGDQQYELKQFHFHKPSEESINGKSFDMVAHLVHADANGKLAVVAVLLKAGEENALVRELWRHLPPEKEKEQVAEGTMVDAANLLPADTGYYTFEGSLTTPPCSEGVRWFVLKHPVTVSASEVAQFGKRYQHNARPTQPLNGRVVQESK